VHFVYLLVVLGVAASVHVALLKERSHTAVLEIFASHGLIAVLLVVGLLGSGLLKQPA